MSLTPGSRLGPYEVVSAIGAGGMGEVYLAVDSRLDRQVALKALPDHVTDDPDRLARFEREAKVMASLNHPNLGQIYGVEEAEGHRYLVLEFVDGETLAARLERGAMPLAEALSLARQIAEGVAAAHEKSVVHRDLKPANIMITGEGDVKVLDFGLARTDDAGGSVSPTDSPTMTTPAQSPTVAGVILGTAGYMSPEQARGRPVDKRSDVFSFGCVLFEMLTGAGPFAGETVTDSLGAVIHKDPDWSALPADTPRLIRLLLSRCLAKDRRQRLRDIGDARVLIDEALASPSEAESSPAAPASRAGLRFAWPIVALVMTIAAGYLALRPAPASAPVIASRFELPVHAYGAVWSDDGSQVAWVEDAANAGRSQRIVLRRLDDFQIRELDVREEQVSEPVFSPDGRWLAYTHAPVGSSVLVTEIRKVPVTGGRPERIATVDIGTAFTTRLAWLGDRVYLAMGRELLEVPATGGTLGSVLTLPEGHSFLGELQIINDGRDVLFSTSPTALWTVPVAGGEPRLVLNDVMAFQVTATGHLLYTSSDPDETHLLGRRFREDTVEVAGAPVPLLEMFFRGWSTFAVSPGGMLAYQLRETGPQEPVWLDRATGRVEPVHPDLAGSFQIQLSPDGQFVVYQEFETSGAGGRRLRAWDVARQRGSVLTEDVNNWAIAAETDAIVFQRGAQTFRLDFPWTSAPVPLSELSGGHRIGSVSPDGRELVVYPRDPSSAWYVVNADGSGGPVPIEGFNTTSSPDGRWVAFNSGSMRGVSELWVRPEPAVSNTKWLLGENGARSRFFWSGDSRQIFYQDPTGQWQSVTVREDRPDAPFELGQTVPVDVPADVRIVGVTPDGSRFLAIRTLPAAPPRLAIIQNFFEELRAKVPGR